jgi:hypothetical protein
MKSVILTSAPLLVLALVLGGCSQTDIRYPSLAKRPIEDQATIIVEEPTPPAVQRAPTNPARMARIRAILDKARQGATQFSRELAIQSPRIQRSGAQGSASWYDAQVALSRLQDARKLASEAIIALDDERRALLTDGPSEDDVAFEEIASEIEAINTEQDVQYRRLAG